MMKYAKSLRKKKAPEEEVSEILSSAENLSPEQKDALFVLIYDFFVKEEKPPYIGKKDNSNSKGGQFEWDKFPKELQTLILKYISIMNDEH